MSPSARHFDRALRDHVPAPMLRTLRELGARGARIGRELFLVGGAVRDLLLDRDTADLDLVCEGDAVALARTLAADLGALCRAHDRFGTASLRFEDGSHIDIATARAEQYPCPGALPRVSPSSLYDDLRRRDFSFNAMALRLDAGHFGELLDPFSAESDLERRIVRVLHPVSFIDDPTRIVRATRFESRLQFQMDETTERLARAAIDGGALDTVTPERLGREILAALGEAAALETAARWADLNILEHLSPGLRPDIELMRRIEGVLATYDPLHQADLPDRSLLRLAALVAPLGPDRARDACQARLRLSDPRAVKLRDALARVPEVLASLDGIDPPARVRALRRESLEALLFAAAHTPRPPRKLLDYLTAERHVKLETTGSDLIALGGRPGPAFGEALQAALDQKLLGHLPARSDEIRFLMARLGLPGPVDLELD